MNSPLPEDGRTTLLTAHKGVDLHAASALLVMKERLEGGGLLENLFRCEVHTIAGAPAGWDGARLLDTGRFFNPNKHHFGLFRRAEDSPDALVGEPAGDRLAHGWAGAVTDTDLPGVAAAALYDALLGGQRPEKCSACDVLSFARGQAGPVVSGVLWRLVLKTDADEARMVGEKLAVARHRKEGLLVNPHMESWFVVAP
jgi:hypothetical protein